MRCFECHMIAGLALSADAASAAASPVLTELRKESRKQRGVRAFGAGSLVHAPGHGAKKGKKGTNEQMKNFDTIPPKFV